MVFVLAIVLLAIVPSVVVSSKQLSCLIVHDDRGSNGQQILIEPYGANGVRVRVVPNASVPYIDDLVSGLITPADGIFTASLDKCARGSLVRDGPSQVTNGNIQAKVGADGRLSFVRLSDNKVLLQEKNVRGMTPTVTSPPLPGFSSVDLEFEAVDGERIYGLGQHRTGSLDNKGNRYSMLPKNTEILIPVAHSSLGFAFLFNLPSSGVVEYNDTSSYWHADTVIQLDFWIATTNDSPPYAISPWAQLQASYANATGHAPVYPEWTTGFWQCKNRYHNQSQVMDVVQGMQERQLPLKLMIIDYYSWAPDPLGDETLPSQCWPDPAAMVNELKEQGIELMISPYFHSIQSTSKYYSSAVKQSLLVQDSKGNIATAYDNAALYDLFQADAREFAFAAVEAGYIKPYGLHHWWLDCDEPCGGNGDYVYNNGTWPASFVGAAYPQMLDRMVYEGMGAPGKEYENDNVMLARSAWAGSQRYGGAVWSGDTSSNFENLNQQFRAGLNLVMSGLPYWTTDIGGYGGGNIDSTDFRELIVRWFQWGAFCPLFRNHGSRSGGPPQGDNGVCGHTGSSNEIWNFGDQAEEAITSVMRLREQMRPYVYEQYQKASAMGTPVMRPLFFDFWNDEGAQAIDDQLMFGPEYMLAPQLLQNNSVRKVYLPQLQKPQVWRNVFTLVDHDTSDGSITINESTPLQGPGFSTFPLYIRWTYIPPPTLPPLPKCDLSCTITNQTDVDSGGNFKHNAVNSSSPADCCDMCKKDSSCTAFVWGPFEYTKGAETCFMFFNATVTQVKTQVGRSYGCVRQA